jgi:hypothetical protein
MRNATPAATGHSSLPLGWASRSGLPWPYTPTQLAHRSISYIVLATGSGQAAITISNKKIYRENSFVCQSLKNIVDPYILFIQEFIVPFIILYI